VKDLYNENYKSQKKKKANKISKMKRHPMLTDRQNQYCENGYATKSNLHVQCNPHQNSSDILHRDRKINPKIHTETQKTLNSQSNPQKKEQSWKYHNT
jgi:hypothetical protein